MPAAATYSAYPTSAECLALFTEVGITLPSGLGANQLDYYRYEAIDEFESETGYEPFLADSSTSQLRFDPPGVNQRGRVKGGAKRLLLNNAFATITEVLVGVTTDFAGTALTVDVDYRTLPLNSAALLQPITEIEFFTTQWGEPGSIRITGKRGYWTSIRAEIWGAIRKLTCARASQGLREKFSQGYVEMKLGDEAVRRSIELLQKFGDTWLKSAYEVIQHNTAEW